MNEAETERYHAELNEQDNEEVREMVITWEETLAASRAEGEARGALIATRNSILRVLSRRFGSVPDYVRQKLDAIRSVERLEEIHDQALTVNSFGDLVLEAEPSN